MTELVLPSNAFANNSNDSNPDTCMRNISFLADNLKNKEAFYKDYRGKGGA